MARSIPHAGHTREVTQYVDINKPVRVYRNLHKNLLSVKQDGLVRCHTDNIVLNDCTFIVSKAGQKRVRDEKKKNVHAFIEGMVADPSETLNFLPFTWEELYYNPYKTEFWTVRDSQDEVESAEWVDIDAYPDSSQVLAFNLTYKRVFV